MTSAIKRRLYWTISGVLLAFLASAPVARADLLLTAQPVTARPGDVNALFNVYLTNVGATPVDVEAFNFEIITTSSDITFEQATTGTTFAPYIFSGNSLFGPVISFSSPGQTLDAADTAAVANSSTTVVPGVSFGLGLVSFDVAPGTASQVASVNFNTNTAFTSVSDPFGNLLPLDFASGTITVSSVPEPATGLLLLVPLAALIACKKLCRYASLR